MTELGLDGHQPLAALTLWCRPDPPPAPPDGGVLCVAWEAGHDLRLGQRANREVVRQLDAFVNRTGRRPRLTLYTAQPPAVAADLGLRLHGYLVEVPGANDMAVRLPAADAELVAPDAPPSAAVWGRALHDLDRAPLVVAGPDGERLVLRGDDARDGVGAARVRAALERARRLRGEGLLDAALEALDAVQEGPGAVEAAFLRAEVLRQQGRAEAAWEALGPARQAEGADVLVRAARLVASLSHPVEAVDLAARATAREPAHLAAWLARAELEGRLQWHLEATASLEAAVRLAPDDPEPRRRLAAHHLAHVDAEAALPHAVAGLARTPSDVVLLEARCRAGLLIRHPEATPWVLALVVAAPGRWVDGVAWLLETGAVEAAEALLARHAGQPGAELVAAHLLLWRGEVDAALRRVGRAPGGGDGLYVRGVAAVLQGLAAAALGLLDQALARQRAGEASPLVREADLLAWRSEARRALGDRAGALADASEAMTVSPTYNVGAHLARTLAVVAPELPDDAPLDPYATAPVAARLGHLAPEPAALGAGRVGPVRAQLEAVRDQLRGNRSAAPTRVVDGRLVAVPVAPTTRNLGRRLQMCLATRGPEAVLDGLAALCAAHPDDPIARTYTGETLLWLDRLDEAAAAFREAIGLVRTTTWAWIGLGATQMLQGDLDEAQRTWKIGWKTVDFQGPTLFVYRGEARWRAGDLDRARKNLDLALEAKPQRLSGWLLRALVDLDAGRTEGARAVVEAVCTRCPGLVADVRAATGASTDRALLRGCLDLMRGNRSAALVTCLLPDGRLRFAAWGRHLRPRAIFPAAEGRT
jgi:tetratricopeptide (TPR) repeat protein